MDKYVGGATGLHEVRRVGSQADSVSRGSELEELSGGGQARVRQRAQVCSRTAGRVRMDTQTVGWRRRYFPEVQPHTGQRVTLCAAAGGERLEPIAKPGVPTNDLPGVGDQLDRGLRLGRPGAEQQDEGGSEGAGARAPHSREAEEPETGRGRGKKRRARGPPDGGGRPSAGHGAPRGRPGACPAPVEEPVASPWREARPMPSAAPYPERPQAARRADTGMRSGALG